MITIDDAGWGCPVLGACIAVVREETGQYHVGRIPTRLFQGQLFGRKEYLKRAREIVERGLRSLRAGKDERIVICSGHILSLAAKELARQGRNVEAKSRIEFKSHEVAERAFRRWLRDVGAPPVDLERRGASFYELTRWVFGSEERERAFGKTGWRSWERWRRYWARRLRPRPRDRAGGKRHDRGG